MMLDVALVIAASLLILFSILSVLALPAVFIFGGISDYPGSRETALLKAVGAILGCGLAGAILVFIINQRRANREQD